MFWIILEPTHPPIYVNVTSVINSSDVAISWGPPQMNNGAPIEGYTIFYRLLDNNQTQQNASRHIDIKSFYFILGMLLPQSTYLIQVCATINLIILIEYIIEIN